MDNKIIANRINDAVCQLEPVNAVGHKNRKQMVIAVEMLFQLAQDLIKEPEKEVVADETAEVE